MIHKALRCLAATLTAITLTAAVPTASFGQQAETTTPIKHVVVIFDENISFDHYFGTYPHAAANASGTPVFHAKSETPRVNNLLSGGLLDENPNTTQPFLLTQPATCDENHGYNAEQSAFDKGLMDMFPQQTGSGNGVDANGNPLQPGASGYCFDAGKGTGIVMGYYDGNTVTGMWNYAQHFAMSDNSYGTNFGPSSVGAINVISGNTCCATLVPFAANGTTPGNPNGDIAGDATYGALIGDPRPGYDNCLTTPVVGTAKSTRVTMSGLNIGDLLNQKNITWGWFAGGFALTGTNPDGTPACGAVSTGLASPGGYNDYIPHHEPFQYYKSTANPNHLPPSDYSKIGKTDQANHQYDLSLFYTAINEGRLPAVSYLKAKGAFDGHPGYSDPIDEQTFVVTTINAIMNSPYWKDTAIIIAYDDSDGWYDHAMDPVVNQSNVADDALTGPGACGVSSATGTNGRCGYGPRLPLIVISPYAKHNYVDHRITDQSSVVRFIEDNWDLGRIGNGSFDVKAGRLNGFFDFDAPAANHKLILDPSTGIPLQPDID
ncbi:MAG TPA: alkaline phosphatase family protein [Candidatus Acidoferrum sp.]|nr:alkaline phosphatase family protein [Candidatus Acidoferrum sp.]